MPTPRLLPACLVAATLVSLAMAGIFSSKTLPPFEKQGLIDIYRATGGDRWTRRDGWLSRRDACTWDGVECGRDEVTGRKTVVKLSLPGNNMRGPTPVFLRGVSQAKDDESRISPVAFRRLRRRAETFDNPVAFPNLRHLDFSGNVPEGHVPSTLGFMEKLEVINLSFNRLDGPIPTALGELKRLYSLILMKNRLTSFIPPELGGATSLERLLLANNDLTGRIPPELGDCYNLRTLDVRHNRLSGAIPKELQNALDLEELYLQGNNFERPLPQWVFDPYIKYA